MKTSKVNCNSEATWIPEIDGFSDDQKVSDSDTGSETEIDPRMVFTDDDFVKPEPLRNVQKKNTVVDFVKPEPPRKVQKKNTVALSTMEVSSSPPEPFDLSEDVETSESTGIFRNLRQPNFFPSNPYLFCAENKFWFYRTMYKLLHSWGEPYVI